MNKFLLSLFAIGLCVSVTAQKSYRKQPALGLHFTLHDFKTASAIRSNGLTSVINSKDWSRTKNMATGLGVSYMEGLSDHIDFVGTLTGTFIAYPVPKKAFDSNERLLLEGTAMANLKLLTDQYWVSPYVSAGVGLSKFRSYFGAFVPVGLGLQVNLYDEAFIMINTQYRLPVTENTAHHLFHSIGIAGNLFKRTEKPVVAPPPPPVVVEAPKDRDGDGILDVNDKCPDAKGLASLQGCPDRDSDGIADNEDNCPDQQGTAKYKGCPIPDTDKDGINDENDRCPNEAGVARYNGCPIPDTDKDGVNDEEDKCIDKPGPASNNGCPEIAQAVVERINYAAKNIFFATGSAKLLAKSFKPLNEVAKILSDDQTLMLDIEGHTDNTGKADKNKTLSENRANAVLAYLKSKGIDASRMQAAGFGADQPVADNKAAAGRAKNRRVEMKVRNN
jgi:OmpA-OmpF porin, OOP family